MLIFYILRLDRLVIIIAEEFLPFYRHWQPLDPSRNKQLLAEICEGHLIWSIPQYLRALPGGDAWMVSESKYVRLSPEYGT